MVEPCFVPFTLTNNLLVLFWLFLLKFATWSYKQNLKTRAKFNFQLWCYIKMLCRNKSETSLKYCYSTNIFTKDAQFHFSFSFYINYKVNIIVFCSIILKIFPKNIKTSNLPIKVLQYICRKRTQFYNPILTISSAIN